MNKHKGIIIHAPLGKISILKETKLHQEDVDRDLEQGLSTGKVRNEPVLVEVDHLEPKSRHV